MFKNLKSYKQTASNILPCFHKQIKIPETICKYNSTLKCFCFAYKLTKQSFNEVESRDMLVLWERLCFCELKHQCFEVDLV